jgi:hypothetical protein
MIERPLGTGSQYEPSTSQAARPIDSSPSEIAQDQPQFDFERWTEEGYPLVVNDLEEADQGEQKAREFFDAYFNKKWNVRSEEKLLYRTLKEVNRLNWMYPEIYEDVMSSRGMDVEDWRRHRRFIASRLTAEEISRRRRGERAKW